MKIISFVFNASLLIMGVILLSIYGLRTRDLFIACFLMLSVATPVVTLFALYLDKAPSWLSLYFKRKAEEKQRIRELGST